MKHADQPARRRARSHGPDDRRRLWYRRRQTCRSTRSKWREKSGLVRWRTPPTTSCCTSTTPDTALMAPAICGETLKRPGASFRPRSRGSSIITSDTSPLAPARRVGKRVLSEDRGPARPVERARASAGSFWRWTSSGLVSRDELSEGLFGFSRRPASSGLGRVQAPGPRTSSPCSSAAELPGSTAATRLPVLPDNWREPLRKTARLRKWPVGSEQPHDAHLVAGLGCGRSMRDTTVAGNLARGRAGLF